MIHYLPRFNAHSVVATILVLEEEQKIVKDILHGSIVVTVALKDHGFTREISCTSLVRRFVPTIAGGIAALKLVSND